MKDQYFGDINDYRKYGLLRGLCGGGQFKLGICWMLTAGDGRPDGRLTSYLRKPEKWRAYDPPLFDCLHQWVEAGQTRDTRLVENHAIIPGAKFFNQVLEDQPARRADYFRDMRAHLANTDLIFYDPDNGIEVQSNPVGKRNSSKYIYWNELCETYNAGQSILIYQHFPRLERSRFIFNKVKEINEKLGAQEITSIRTPHVVYFLVAQNVHAEYLAACVKRVEENWQAGHQIQIV
jgi:hypothetical protein